MIEQKEYSYIDVVCCPAHNQMQGSQKIFRSHLMTFDNGTSMRKVRLKKQARILRQEARLNNWHNFSEGISPLNLSILLPLFVSVISAPDIAFHKSVNSTE